MRLKEEQRGKGGEGRNTPAGNLVPRADVTFVQRNRKVFVSLDKGVNDIGLQAVIAKICFLTPLLGCHSKCYKVKDCFNHLQNSQFYNLAPSKKSHDSITSFYLFLDYDVILPMTPSTPMITLAFFRL